MPRIIAGEFKGFKLACPKGRHTRPTADKVKEAIFSILASLHFNFSGSKVLDLFAGSGALGIEALSRGANEAVFVDCLPEALAAVKQNLRLINKGHETAVIKSSWPQNFEALVKAGPFDLLLLDPPYEYGTKVLAWLKKAAQQSLVKPGSVAVWEQAPETLKIWEESEAAPWSVIKTRSWGGQAVAFLSLGDKEF